MLFDRFTRFLVIGALVSAAATALATSPSAAPLCLPQPPRVLDQLHHAAAKADANTYFQLFMPAATFVGTDADEIWSLAEFKRFAEPYFAKGQGWTYRVTWRQVKLSSDQTTAWFVERLYNESYGETRGSGVLVKQSGCWRIAQYHLTIPIPNHLAKNIVSIIQQDSKASEK
ncbi:MAG: nuclear transport factor 2 family protein [Gammaproteobacteria bacterium]|nr:nuclear transport factor 2 family protein [Gammaproteobacteria bacterium]